MKNFSFLRGLLCLCGLLLFAFSFVPQEAAAGFLSPELLQLTFGSGGGILAFSPLVTQFANDIAENIYPDNAFYKKSRDDKAYIQGAKVVLPQAGSKPGVVRNRPTVPATVGKREDTGEDYDIDEFTTDPIVIQNTEGLVVSYDKRSSLLFDHTEQLKTNIATNFAHIWSPTVATNILRTSGTHDPIVGALAPGATGTRKPVSEADIVRVFDAMNNMDISQEGRVALFPASMYAQLLGIDNFKLAQLINRANQVDGKIDKLYGFDIYLRSSGAIYDNAATPQKKAFGSVGTGTDNLAALFWHPSFVRRAEGDVTVMEDSGTGGNGSPTFYGTVYSAIVRAGGRISRADQKGVVALVQAPTV